MKTKMLLIMLVIIGCATAIRLPGDANHNWLRGKWMTQRESGWITELRLEVVDGNIVIGNNFQTAPDGRRGKGDVRGRVEGEKVDFDVYFPGSGNTHSYTLVRRGNTLQGKSSTGSVILQKVS